MKGFAIQRTSFLPIMVIPMTIVLLFSFGLHTVQVDHTHPGVHTTSNDHHEGEADPSSFTEYLHGSEKKLFLLLVLGFLALGMGLSLVSTALSYTRYISYNKIRSIRDLSLEPRLFDIHKLLFCSGILHPKVY